jgi:ATP-dependent DNA helicase RecG
MLGVMEMTRYSDTELEEKETYIDNAPETRVASAQEELILNEKRAASFIPFDIRPVYGATLEDLSRGFFEEEYLSHAFAKQVLAANHRTYEERLASCKFIVSPENTTPTFLGLMAIGKNPRNFIPSSYIQFLRIDGYDERAPILDNTVIDGRIMAMYDTALVKFKGYNKRATDVLSGPRQIVKSDYPETAYNQILVNALLHRQYEGTNTNVSLYWYNDRIEITSPGGPFGTVTTENFGQNGARDYRNRNLADVIQNLDLMQRFGFGIKWARDAMAENGNPPIEFNVTPNMVQVILRK